ncbi:MAG: RsmB/NOP family class I SAM-dependent RNA methyltransferase [Candidatus Omnitrophica bacterium]|nr:RsmB/NOP family class I SAM-dependent RNA methyltransferase [Candidatus Omnitrophota bacterium]
MREIVYKLPYEFLSRLEQLYPNHYQQIINTFINKKPTTFRINYLKTDLLSLRKNLLQERIRFQELKFPAGAFVAKEPLRQLQETKLYKLGHIYVQNISSMIPPLILSPKNGETILDLCAAPGAKTTEIVSLAPDALVTATERDRIRYYQLLSNLEIQGAGKVSTMLIDGIWVRKKFPEYFDKILLDAPCTAEGRFFLHNPRTYKYWKEKKVRELSRKQKDLLAASFFALKEGGELVYSTCTFSPEENEGVIDWFLAKFNEKIEIIPFEIPIRNVFQGITQWQGKHFSSSCRLARRIIPDEFMEGFFIAKLRKLHSA